MTDGHKWLMAPKGSGALWASRSLQDILEPAIISSDNAVGRSKFQDRFDYIGTRDYTSWCAMGAALDFRDMLGGLDTMHEDGLFNQHFFSETCQCRLFFLCFQDISYHYNHFGLNDARCFVYC